MSPIDLLWHVLNFFAPAAGVGLIAPTLAKLLWRRGLAGVGWARLAAWVTIASAMVLLAGLWCSAATARWQPMARWC